MLSPLGHLGLRASAGIWREARNRHRRDFNGIMKKKIKCKKLTFKEFGLFVDENGNYVDLKSLPIGTVIYVERS